MRILLDNCIDQRFAALFPAFDIVHARAFGWAAVKNGELIAQAESAGFDALITVDKNLRYQQNIAGRKIAIIVIKPKS